MKRHGSRRPIGKCRGCELNMRTFCAAGLEPYAEWDAGRCRFRNRSLSEVASSRLVPVGAKVAKERRRARATMLATKSHADGFAVLSHYHRPRLVR